MEANYQISIVIPVFNSEDNLELLLLKINEAMIKYRFEAILINDCSKDASWSVMKRLSHEYKFLTVINLRKNSGQDNAIMCGLTYATGKYIVIMDDDLQHSPFDIPKLYEEIIKGFDLVYANFNTKKQALWKNIGSWINGKVAEILIKKPKNIYLSPFKIIHNEVIKEILNYKGPYPYIDGLLFLVTTNITQINNVTHHKRNAGQSNFNLRRSIRVFLKLATNFSIIPLRISTVLGFLSSFISFILGLYFLFEYFWLKNIPEGFTSMILVLLFLGGLILISLGMIGEYLGRLFMNNNRISAYIIKEIISNKK